MTSPPDPVSPPRSEPAPPPPPEATRAASPAPVPSIRSWARHHDESWIFVVVYLGLAVGLSIFVSLFWLVVVAGLHLALELYRQRYYRVGRRSVVAHALWEVKLDVGLVLLALTLVLYIEVVLGILGIQSAARAAAVSRVGARVGTRAAAWERNLRTFLLTVDEMIRVGHAAVLMRRKRARSRGTPTGGLIPPSEGGERPASREGLIQASDMTPGTSAPGIPAPGDASRGPQFALPSGRARPVPRPPAWSGRWKLGDRIGAGLVLAGILLIVAAPWLTPHDGASALAALVEELRPFPRS